MAELKINEEREVKVTRTYDLVGLTEAEAQHLRALLGVAPANGPKGKINYELYGKLKEVPYPYGYFTNDTRIRFNDSVEDGVW